MESLWMAEHDRICEEIAAGNLDKEEAVSLLRRLGLDTGEALDLFAELRA